MSREQEGQERPRLYCMMVELIDDFFGEHHATKSIPDQQTKSLTRSQRQSQNRQPSRMGSSASKWSNEIMHYDGEFRREEATSAVGSHAKH
jgi:hypothetical protein